MANDPGDDVTTIVVIFFTLGAFALLILSAVFALPLIAAGVGGYAFFRWWRNSPVRLEKRERKLLDQLYADAKRISPNTLNKEEFGMAVLDELPPRPKEVTRPIVRAALTL